MIIDAHCHLNDDQFKQNRNEIIKRALENNLRLILVPGWDIHSSKLALDISNEHKEIYAAVGIHPENIDGISLDDINIIKELALNKKVISIGEIGLDYHYTKENKDKQIEFFESQLELAYNLDLPVSIHVRDSMGDFVDVIRNFFKTHKIKENFGMMHSYSGSVETMKELLKYGFYFSFNGVVTFKNAITQKEAALYCPIDKILTETDSPYLTPVPKRGEINEPSNTKFILEYIANLKQIDIKYLMEQVEINFKTLFNLKED